MGEVTSQIAIVPGVLAACFAGPAAALFVMIRRNAKARQNRRSPIGIAMLRGPGHSLREQLDEAHNNLTWDLVLLMVVPLLALALFLAQSHLSSSSPASPGLAPPSSPSIAGRQGPGKAGARRSASHGCGALATRCTNNSTRPATSPPRARPRARALPVKPPLPPWPPLPASDCGARPPRA
jgi:hypothetical protein